MTPQQVVGLAARLFSIWLAIGAFQALVMAKAILSSGGDAAAWVPYAIAAMYLAGALILWCFPTSIAHKLVPRTRFEDKLQLPAPQVIVVACVVLGLLVIVLRALPPLASYASIAALWIASGQPLSTLEGSRHIDAFVGLVQLTAGALLVAKAHPISERRLPAAVG
jgi:hypothetical protein